MKKLLSILIILTVTLALVTPALALEYATNVALNQTATQSTTAIDWEGFPSKAVDGNTDGDFGEGSVTHTKDGGEKNPWWQVDIAQVEHIHKIKIWNRTHGYGHRLNNFYVFISDKDFTSNDPVITLSQANVTAFYFPGIAGDSTELIVNTPGRFIRIQILSSEQILSLAEVEVFKVNDEITPTGTITYSTTEVTTQDVVATLSTSKPVTITNNGGLPTYIFDSNDSFTFEYIDAFGHPGSTIATVSNILPPLSNYLSYIDFHEDIHLYTIVVPGELNSLALYPYSSDSQESIKINGNFLKDGYFSSVPLEIGGNKIIMDLIDQSDQVVNTYTIIVLRPMEELWNIGDVVRAIHTELDINDDGQFDRQDIRGLLEHISFSKNINRGV